MDQDEPNVSDKNEAALPRSFQITVRGFSDESHAREVADTVGELIRLLSEHFDLRNLDGITIAHDYVEAVQELDRGFETKALLKPSDGHVIGVAMTPSVLRSGSLKSHILLNASLASDLINSENENFSLALHIVAHECAHVEISSLFDAVFPGVLLREHQPDTLSYFKWDCILACWDEYAATRLSAKFGEDPTDGYEETFLKHLRQAREIANDHIKAYRTHGNLDRVLTEVYTEYGCLMKFAAYHLGNLDGQGIKPEERIETVAALENHWFAPYFDRLATCCRNIADEYGGWEGRSLFQGIGDLLEEVLALGGLHFQSMPMAGIGSTFHSPLIQHREGAILTLRTVCSAKPQYNIGRHKP